MTERPKGWTDRAWFVAIAVALLAAVIDVPLVTLNAVTMAFWAGVLLGQRDAYEHDDWLDAQEARRG